MGKKKEGMSDAAKSYLRAYGKWKRGGERGPKPLSPAQKKEERRNKARHSKGAKHAHKGGHKHGHHKHAKHAHPKHGHKGGKSHGGKKEGAKRGKLARSAGADFYPMAEAMNNGAVLKAVNPKVPASWNPYALGMYITGKRMGRPHYIVIAKAIQRATYDDLSGYTTYRANQVASGEPIFPAFEKNLATKEGETRELEQDAYMADLGLKPGAPKEPKMGARERALIVAARVAKASGKQPDSGRTWEAELEHLLGRGGELGATGLAMHYGVKAGDMAVKGIKGLFGKDGEEIDANADEPDEPMDFEGGDGFDAGGETLEPMVETGSGAASEAAAGAAETSLMEEAAMEAATLLPAL